MKKPYLFRDDQARGLYDLAMAAAKDARDIYEKEWALQYDAIAETISQQLHVHEGRRNGTSLLEIIRYETEELLQMVRYTAAGTQEQQKEFRDEKQLAFWKELEEKLADLISTVVTAEA